MSRRELTLRFGTLFLAYVADPHEEHLAHIADLGEELVRAHIPPEDIAEIFEEALLALSKANPRLTLGESANRITIPLMEMLMAYGLAFREQLSRQRVYEETKLAARVIENAYEGIWVADRSGEVLISNPALSRIAGDSGDTAPGPGLEAMGLLDANGSLMKKIWTDVRESGCWRGELSLRRKGGGAFPARLTLSSIRDDDGAVSNHVGVLEDITDERRHEESRALELARAKEIYDLVMKPDLPVFEGMRINVECRPAEDIGGDFLHLLRVDGDRLLVFLADVAGHGVPAAMTANSIKMLLKEIVLPDIDPGTVCTRLNRAFCGHVLPDDMIAGFCGLFDVRSMRLTYCLAGLPAPVISRQGEIVALRPTGPPLGVFDRVEYTAHRLSLARGDLFFAYTDGITEARDEKGRLFGNAGVQHAVAGTPLGETSAFGAAARLLGDLTRFRRSGFSSDDVILMAMEWLGEAPPVLGSSPGAWSRFATEDACLFVARTRDIHLDDVIGMVMKSLEERCPLSPDEFGKIRLALFELLSNAVEHGNLEMTDLKRNPEIYDTEMYRRLYQERLKDPGHGDRLVRVELRLTDNEIRMAVEDEGRGFDMASVADPTRAENVLQFTGRGLRIARLAVDELTCEPKGRRVTLRKKIRGHLYPEKGMDAA